MPPVLKPIFIFRTLTPTYVQLQLFLFSVFINVKNGLDVLLEFPPCALSLKIKITQHRNTNRTQPADCLQLKTHSGMKTSLIQNNPICNKFFDDGESLKKLRYN